MKKYIIKNAKGWDHPTLRALMEASYTLKIEAWGVCGLFYRPFLNNVFGPPQIGSDADVACKNVEDAAKLYDWLKIHHGWRRWAVKSIERKFPFGNQPITLRLGAVRMLNIYGDLEVVVDSTQVLDNLQKGIITFNEKSRSSYRSFGECISAVVGRANKLINEYPNLQLGRELLINAYTREFGEHTPVPYVVPGRVTVSKPAKTPTWSGLNADEIPLAMEVVKHDRNAVRQPSAVLPVSPAKLPIVLQAQADRKVYAKVKGINKAPITVIDPPEGFESWLHWMCYEAKDSMFREWLLNQTRSRKPFGGKDSYLASVLDYSIYQNMSLKYKGQQKANHCGWLLAQHNVAATLSLQTDSTFSLLRKDNVAYAKQVRAGLRLGVLHHDIGKLMSINRSGAHSGASVKMWRDTLPTWVDAETDHITRFVIMGHDFFGRLARGITEKPKMSLYASNFNPNAQPSYDGAVCPGHIVKVIRQHGIKGKEELSLKLLRLTWEADANSVQSLRWAVTVAPLCEKIVRLRLVNS